MVRPANPDYPAMMADPAKKVHPAVWEPPEAQECLDNKDHREPLVALDPLVIEEREVFLVLQDRLDQKGKEDHQDQLVNQDLKEKVEHQDPREIKDGEAFQEVQEYVVHQVQMVMQVHLVHRVHLGLQDPMALEVPLAKREDLANLVSLEGLDPEDQLVTMEDPENQDHPDPQVHPAQLLPMVVALVFHLCSNSLVEVKRELLAVAQLRRLATTCATKLEPLVMTKVSYSHLKELEMLLPKLAMISLLKIQK